MKKEYLEALERLYKCNDDDYTLGYQQHDYKLLQQALQRLESIDNANPSEALKTLEDLRKQVSFANSDGCIFNDIYEDIIRDIEIIKQALIKSQEQEKQLGCPLEVRLQVDCDTIIYDEDGYEYNVDYVYKNNFICHNGQCDDFGCDYEFTFNWNDYKKTWWLKKDKSE